eukprot:g10943.t1
MLPYSVFVCLLFISLLLVIVLDKQQQCKATTAAKNGKRSNGTLRILIASPLYIKDNKQFTTEGSKGLLAATLAIDIINNKTDGFFDDLLPNTSIVYEFCDTGKSVETTPKLAFEAVSNAFNGRGADIVLGTGTSSTSVVLTSILNYHQIPMISPASKSELLTTYNNFMRTIPANDVIAKGIPELAKRIGWNAACVIHGSDAYSKTGASSLVTATYDAGLEILGIESFINGAKNMRLQTDLLVSTGSKLFLYFGQSDDIPSFARSLYYSLVERDLLSSGFSIIYPDTYFDKKENYRDFFLKNHELHIYRKMFNGTFAISLNSVGNFTHQFYNVFKDAVHSFNTCYGKEINSSQCEMCGNGKLNPKNDELLFSSKQNGKQYCGAVSSNEDKVDYTTAFYFDAVLYIAATTHKYLQQVDNSSISKLYTNEAFFKMATGITNPVTISGATGNVKLSVKGDRDLIGLGFNIWNSKISGSGDIDQLFLVGIFDLVSKIFKCCNEMPFYDDYELLISPMLRNKHPCTPGFIFNSPDYKLPGRLAANRLTFNLALATSVYVVQADGTISLDESGATRTLAILLAIEHLNNKTNNLYDNLLDNTPINYVWKNTGRNYELATEAAMHFARRSAFDNDRVADGIIGPFISGSTMTVQSLIKHIPIMQLSPSATSPLLSDDNLYPYFVRTVLDDGFTVKALVDIVRNIFSWDEVGIISDTSVYSNSLKNLVLKEGALIDLKFFPKVEVMSDFVNYATMKSAVRTNTRVFIVLLHTHRIYKTLSVISEVAKELLIDEREFSFIFIETVLSLESLPSIANGSFALNRGDDGKSDTKYQKIETFNTVMRQAINKVKECAAMKNISSCDCLKPKWKTIFVSNNTCYFPTKFNAFDSYIPLSYDAVISFATVYNHILKVTKGHINGNTLYQALIQSDFDVSGITGAIKFKSNGDRNGENVNFTLLNSDFIGTNVVWESKGIIQCRENRQVVFYSNNKDFNYGTVDNVKPKSVLKSCFTNDDCEGEHSYCLVNGKCKCGVERIGLKCRQKLFKRGVEHLQNLDGSKRCLTHIKPKLQASAKNLRVGFRSWDSQSLVSELFMILLYEMMGIETERYNGIVSGPDCIVAIGEKRCDLVLENWDILRWKEPLNKYVIDRNDSKPVVRWVQGMGYGARNGWYVNNAAAFQDDTALNIYASYRQNIVAEQLNNASIYNKTGPYFQNCSSEKPNLQSDQYCDAGSGAFRNPKCNEDDINCGKILAGKLTWAENVIQRQILGLDLHLAVHWIGGDGIKKLVSENLHSKEPFLFYWWYPDKFTAGPAGEVRVKFPTYKKEVWDSTGGCDWPESKIDKLVHVSVHPIIQLFLEDFKVSNDDINKLLNLKKDGVSHWQAACNFLKDKSNFERMSQFIPLDDVIDADEKNIIQLGYKSSYLSSHVISNILVDLFRNQLQMKVVVSTVESDIEGMIALHNRHLDLFVDMDYISDQQTIEKNLFENFISFPLGYTTQIGIYLSIPPSSSAKINSINHYMFSNELAKHLPPLGTFEPCQECCSLWWCAEANVKVGHYVPSLCRQKPDECGEILVSNTLFGTLPNWSILPEIVESLKLPLAIVFVNASTLSYAQNSDKHVIAFLSTDNERLSSLNRVTLPDFVYSCMEARKTTYTYNNPLLGEYRCDFPQRNAYVLASNRLMKKVKAVTSLLERFYISKTELIDIGQSIGPNKSSANVKLISKRWIADNVKTWKPWIIGCEDEAGYYGVEGKCNACPSGSYSLPLTNVCNLCQRGKVGLHYAQTLCVDCPEKTTTLYLGSNALEACYCINGVGNADTTCSKCPKDAVCHRGNFYVPDKYWRFDYNSTELFECPIHISCLGAPIIKEGGQTNDSALESCAEHYEGNLCNTCATDFAKGLYGTCEKCQYNVIFVVVVTASLTTIAIVISVQMSKGPSLKYQLLNSILKKIQYLTSSTCVAVYIIGVVKEGTARFLHHYTLSRKGTLSLQRKSQLSPQRSQRRVSLNTNILNIHKLISAREDTVADEKRESSSHLSVLPRKININKAFPEIKESILLCDAAWYHDEVTMVSYSNFFKRKTKEILIVPIMTDLHVVGGFIITCHDEKAENTIAISTRKQKTLNYLKTKSKKLLAQGTDLTAIAIKIFLCHLQLFVMAKYLVIKCLTDHHTRQFLGMLYSGFKLEYYWWEAVIMFRKSALVACICIFYSHGVAVQISFVLTVLTFFLALDFAVSPYCWKDLEYLERGSLFVLLLTFQAANLSHNGYFNPALVEVFMVVINAVYVLFFLYVIKSDIALFCDKVRNRLYNRLYTASDSHSNSVSLTGGVEMVENPLNNHIGNDLVRKHTVDTILERTRRKSAKTTVV